MSTKTIVHAADLPALVERYFCEYLIKQRSASPETISSYRDAFRLFLRFLRRSRETDHVCFRKLTQAAGCVGR